MKASLIRRLMGVAVALVVGATMMLASPARAADKLTLSDGSVLEGTVIREIDGNVWLKYTIAGVEQTKMFTATEYKKLERDTAGGEKKDESAPVAPKPAGKQPQANPKPGVPRAVVVTLGETRDEKQGDMVGIYMTAYALEQMMPLLEEQVGNDGTGVVVLRVNSGGGALLEIQKISDVLHEKYKKKFRTVGWIDSAISAAAMSSLCLEEIYFSDKANFGACTGWYGNLVAVKGIELERVLLMMEKISARGGYNPLIMRSMQITEPLSATRLPNGEMKFFPDESSGEFIVNRKNEILTFNAQSALKVGFSKGTASTLDELTKVMGYTELQWVGEDTVGSLYPLSKAEKWNIAFRKQAKTDEDRTQEYFASYQLNMQAAASETTREGRAKFIGRARQALEKIKAMVRNNPNFIMFALNMPNEEEYKKFLAEQEKTMRDMMR
ncbi:MAG: hypothetical protein NTV94_02700 [Planctomycetota bacterium]|nr:hypothetical protein [Planctomycetota bacterium]